MLGVTAGGGARAPVHPGWIRPWEKSTNAKIFRVMVDFNPRRHYIVVTYTLNFYLFQKLAYSVINLANIFPLPCGAGSAVPREGFDSSVIMPFSWCVVAVTLPI